MNNSSNMIKVAHVTKFLKSNGITNVIMNYSSHLDKSSFMNTIIAGAPISEIYRNQCNEEKVEVKELPSKDKSSLGYYISLFKFFQNGKYDIVHIHGNSATITVEMLLAKIAGIKVRIAHCHNSTCDHVYIHKLLSPFFKRLYTKGYACSDLAGKFMFGNSPYTVLTNGFEIDKFIFNQEKRDSLRQKLNLDNKFVIGNVARFNDQKNHIFLLDIFKQIASVDQDAVLFLVGAGPLLDKIKQLISEHPYKERIIYYGETDHVEDLYNAMDIFVLPSKYEGLGIVFIEAQINGLKCVTSDHVPSEVNINNHTVFLSLSENIEKWCIEALSTFSENRIDASMLAYKSAQEYNIHFSVKQLENDYRKLLDK